MSGQGNQHNNGPHQDQIFDNPSALCLALWAKNQIWLGVCVCVCVCVGGGGGGGGGTDTPNKLFMQGVQLSVSPFLKIFVYPVRFTLFKDFQI